MKYVSLDTEVAVVGHYTPAIISNGMLYISGLLPIDCDTGKIVGSDAITQASWVFRNLERILQVAGLRKEDVVQCRIYTPDITYWEVINGVYAHFFGCHKPARIIVPSGALHHGALLEVEAIAEMEDK